MTKGREAPTKKGKYVILVYDKVVGEKAKSLQKAPAEGINPFSTNVPLVYPLKTS